MKTPDITKAQILALVTAAAGLAVVFGIDITPSQTAAIIAFVSAVLVFLPLSDAVIRQGRAKISAAAAVRPPPAPVTVQTSPTPVFPSAGGGTTFVATAASAATPKTPPKPRVRRSRAKTPPKT